MGLLLLVEKTNSNLAAFSYRTMQDTPLISTKLNNRAKPPNDESLIEWSRMGDEQAFRIIVERYSPRIISTVTHMLGPGLESSEVSHDVFTRFYHALDSLNEEVCLSAYLHRIAVNLSLNVLKRRKKWYQRFSSLDAMAPNKEPLLDPIPRAETNDYIAIIHKAIQQLQPKLRAVAVLRLVQEFSTKETAEMLEIPVGTVLSRLSRAQARLRIMLEPYIEK